MGHHRRGGCHNSLLGDWRVWEAHWNSRFPWTTSIVPFPWSSILQSSSINWVKRKTQPGRKDVNFLVHSVALAIVLFPERH